MSPIVQQRLIGSILLLCALGGIAFFLINSASDDVELIPDSNPDIPFISSIDAIVSDNDIEIVEAAQVTLVDPQQLAVEAAATPVASPVISEPEEVINNAVSQPVEEKPIPAATPSSTTWSLQLASLADQVAAETLRKKVELLGYKVTVEKAETEKGDRFRVRIGPEQDKLALETVAEDIEKKLNLKPLMLKQIP